jgi:hypothetical protein
MVTVALQGWLLAFLISRWSRNGPTCCAWKGGERERASVRGRV